MVENYTRIILVQDCTFCDRTLELTEENFKKSKFSKTGFVYNCRRCPGGRRCVEKGCTNLRPSYGLHKRGFLYCSYHGKLKGYNDIKTACICGRTERRFGFVGGERLCCTLCRKPDMIDLKTPRCFCGRSKPTFGLQNTKPTHCKKCKESGMIDVIHKKCIVCKEVIPSFGLIRGKATHCSSCKTDGLIDVVNPGCKCGKVSKPHYGYSNSIAECCIDCKEPGMIPVYRRFCQICGLKSARFSVEGQLSTHCTSCRNSGMILTANLARRCIKCRLKLAAFSGEKTKEPVYCASCREYGSQRVVGNFCIYENCCKLASFGFPGTVPAFCAVHRQNGTIFRPRRNCAAEDCRDFAVFGTGSPLHCEIHKQPEELDLIQKTCNSCGLISIVTMAGLCSYCDLTNNRPTYMHRQRIINSLLQTTNFSAELVGVDQLVAENSCGRERPDFVWDCSTHFVILEVDENQHKSYPKECEIIRMINIAQSLGGPPVVFIRYNPDSYRTKKLMYNTRQSFRHKTLITFLKEILRTPPINFTEAVYIFYDGWEGLPRREIVQKYE